jgi:hypothetical protein
VGNHVDDLKINIYYTIQEAPTTRSPLEFISNAEILRQPKVYLRVESEWVIQSYSSTFSVKGIKKEETSLTKLTNKANETILFWIEDKLIMLINGWLKSTVL